LKTIYSFFLFLTPYQTRFSRQRPKLAKPGFSAPGIGVLFVLFLLSLNARQLPNPQPQLGSHGKNSQKAN
jgi:hypothetical protein